MSERRKRKPIAAQSQATQRPVGTNQHSEGADNKSGVSAPYGTSATYAERRLRKDRPDLYALHRLLRNDRKPTGGFVTLANYIKFKSVAAA
jgi:hypothetical protein